MSGFVPGGFRLSGVHCGIKSNPAKNDLTLIVADQPCVAAGVYTRNLIFAAPVAVDRARTPSTGIRTVVANSGNANACTGDRGMRDAQEMARLGAAVCQAADDQALVLSTGIIGEYLPMEKISRRHRVGRPVPGPRRGFFLPGRPRHPDHRSQPQGGPSNGGSGRAIDPDRRHGQGGRDDRPEHGHDAGHRPDRCALDRGDGSNAAAADGGCQLQLHQRRRAHEHQRHAVAAGQRTGGRRTVGESPTSTSLATACWRCASSWHGRFPTTAKGPRT